ncbi:hypothetical protein Tsubulata_045563 [Turnera subulata]|uniref:Stress induced protein n=1 Tax=Turnera subulata TaxID=218843 RepID=A0A9Q0FJ63_9ROSI|nr:hypothetical protein Tsubulata_045563 [Turnera subulata]
MAKPQVKVTFMDTTSPAIIEHDHEEENLLQHNYEEEMLVDNGCNCFGIFSSKWRHAGKYQQGEHRETWVVKKLKKVKEVSEVVAGPKWKTFIRKISAYFKSKRRFKNNQFQYDAQSYALNFDEGADEDEDYCFQPFSSRFSAPIPVGDRRGNGL